MLYIVEEQNEDMLSDTGGLNAAYVVRGSANCPDSPLADAVGDHGVKKQGGGATALVAPPGAIGHKFTGATSASTGAVTALSASGAVFPDGGSTLGDAAVDTIMFTGTADFTAGTVERRRARLDVMSASRRRLLSDLGDKQVISSGEAGRRFHP